MTRVQLVGLVELQREKWPWTDHDRKFIASKTKVSTLREALLEPSYGFTTANSGVQANVPSSSGHHEGGLEHEGGTLGTGNAGDDGLTVVCLFLLFLASVLFTHHNFRKKGRSGLLQSSLKTGVSHLRLQCDLLQGGC
jgi:hypothetical protein